MSSDEQIQVGDTVEHRQLCKQYEVKAVSGDQLCLLNDRTGHLLVLLKHLVRKVPPEPDVPETLTLEVTDGAARRLADGAPHMDSGLLASTNGPKCTDMIRYHCYRGLGPEELWERYAIRVTPNRLNGWRVRVDTPSDGRHEDYTTFTKALRAANLFVQKGGA